MENHIWSIIAKRMKNNHTSWSYRGGNHLAKILAKKCSGKLHEVTGCLERALFKEEVVEEIKEKILSSAKAPYKVGKGYGYPVTGHLAGLDVPIRVIGRSYWLWLVTREFLYENNFAHKHLTLTLLTMPKHHS